MFLATATITPSTDKEPAASSTHIISLRSEMTMTTLEDDGVAKPDDSLAMIVSIGYTQEQAKEAIENNINVDDAIDALFLGHSGKKEVKSSVVDKSEPTVETDPPQATSMVEKSQIAPTKSIWKQDTEILLPDDEEATMPSHNRSTVGKTSAVESEQSTTSSMSAKRTPSVNKLASATTHPPKRTGGQRVATR